MILDTLTKCERRVLECYSEGMTQQEVADALHVSVKTVQTHRTVLGRKLGVHSAPELVAVAVGLFKVAGLIDENRALEQRLEKSRVLLREAALLLRSCEPIIAPLGNADAIKRIYRESVTTEEREKFPGWFDWCDA